MKHRHLAEIEEQLALHTGAPTILQFNPHLAPMRRPDIDGAVQFREDIYGRDGLGAPAIPAATKL